MVARTKRASRSPTSTRHVPLFMRAWTARSDSRKERHIDVAIEAVRKIVEPHEAIRYPDEWTCKLDCSTLKYIVPNLYRTVLHQMLADEKHAAGQ
jgi:hypothetical protein